MKRDKLEKKRKPAASTKLYLAKRHKDAHAKSAKIQRETYGGVKR